ncbi:MAG: DUF1266 domain-containing protein [Haliea sp.]|nr:MAG: DUF1266 domain-containing protein [Haliea sp.]
MPCAESRHRLRRLARVTCRCGDVDVRIGASRRNGMSPAPAAEADRGDPPTARQNPQRETAPMFKFFKELVDSAKEGLAEAKAELAEEQAAKDEAGRAATSVLIDRLAATSPREAFAVALAAPYRQVFLRELSTATREERPAVYLRCMAIPDGEIEDWKKLLDRDFSVTDALGAQTTVADMVDQLDTLDSDEALALWLVRASHLATGSAAVGYVPVGEALEWLAPALQAAIDNFNDWESFGQAFLAGEPTAPGSNVLGRKFLAGAVDSLLKDPLSPWVGDTWPDGALG